MNPPIIRFIILLLAALCITSVLSNMNAYNFTKICYDPWNRSTNRTKMGERYAKIEQSALQSSVAIGALAAGVPYSILLQKYDRRLVFLSAGVISTVATALIPLADGGGFWPFLITRIVQGVGFSPAFAMMGAATTAWAPLAEHGFFLAVLTGCMQLANIITMPVAGVICSSSLGWPAVFYIHAGASAVLFALWAVFYRDTPGTHFLVGTQELARIGRERTAEEDRSNVPVPFGALLRSKCIWAVWIAAFGDLVCTQLISMYNPIFMNTFLQFTVMTSGFYAALPVVAQYVFKIIAGIISDAVTCVDETTKVRLFNSLALGVSGLLFIALGFVPRDATGLAVALLILTMGTLGTHSAGFNKCATLHARQHSHFVMAMIVNIWGLAILVEPYVAEAILVDRTSPSQWRALFVGHGVVLLATNAIFVFLADARPAIWTLEQKRPLAVSISQGTTETAHSSEAF